MLNVIKGLLIGIGKIIPGVSGSVIAISLGVYNRLLNNLSNIRKINKKECIFLLEIGIGIIISIILFSKLILLLLNKYYFYTMFVFLGLIVGGTKEIYDKTKEKKEIRFLIVFLIPILFLYTVSIYKLNIKINIYNIFFVGIIEAITMIIPGISGTAVMMSLGIYEEVLNLVTSINLLSLTFVIGIAFGIISLAKLLNYLINNFEYEFYYLISSFTLVSILTILKSTLSLKYNIIMLIIGALLFIVGYFISKKM